METGREEKGKCYHQWDCKFWGGTVRRNLFKKWRPTERKRCSFSATNIYYDCSEKSVPEHLQPIDTS